MGSGEWRGCSGSALHPLSLSAGARAIFSFNFHQRLFLVVSALPARGPIGSLPHHHNHGPGCCTPSGDPGAMHGQGHLGAGRAAVMFPRQCRRGHTGVAAPGSCRFMVAMQVSAGLAAAVPEQVVLAVSVLCLYHGHQARQAHLHGALWAAALLQV